MVTVSFTPHLQRQAAAQTCQAPAGTLREVLNQAFASQPRVRGYVLADQGAIRKHVAVFINHRAIAGRQHLTDAVPEGAEVFVLQALSHHLPPIFAVRFG